MQEYNGFIKVFRKLKKWGWYQNSVVKDLFLHFLLTASFKEFEWEGYTIKAGQLITGRKTLADELGFSEQQIRTGIKKLESTGEITTIPTNRYTIVTVVNWEDYQGDENYSTNIVTNNQPTTNQQLTNNQPHIKNIKNKKNIKNSKNNARARTTILLSQVVGYVKENNLNVDAEKFFEYYSGRGWVTNDGQPIEDWQSVLRSWSKNEKKPAPTYPNSYSGIKKLSED